MKLEALALAKELELDMSEVHPFVFKFWGKSAVEMPKSESEVILAPPFPKFTIEVEGHFISQGRRTDEHDVCMSAIYCEEVAPNVYNFGLRMRMTVDGRHIYQSIWVKHDDPQQAVYPELIQMVNLYIERMNKQYMGQIRCSGKLTYRNKDNKKKVYKPSNIIYVTDKSKKFTPANNPQPKTEDGQYVRHLRISTVMAHWRKLVNPESYGLDRSGKRTIKGRTFIKSYTRGDGETAPPKIRVVS